MEGGLLLALIAHHFVALSVNAYGVLRCIREHPEPPDLEPLLASITYHRLHG